MHPIADAVYSLRELGVEVLSPADPTVVDQRGEFLFVASDAVRSVRMVQDRHLESVRASDFLWLVCPDGYVGQSASMEIGFAAAVGTPVFSTGHPEDLTLAHYVHPVDSLSSAVNVIRTIKLDAGGGPPKPSFLLDPYASLERAQVGLERIRGILAQQPQRVDDLAARRIYEVGSDLRSLIPPVNSGILQRM